MPETLTVRVVLPSDRLVRITCAGREARVRGILDALAALGELREAVAPLHSRKLETLSIKSVAKQHVDVRVFPLGALTQRDASPQDGGVKSAAFADWKLLLVRAERELTLDACAGDELLDMDILELQPCCGDDERKSKHKIASHATQRDIVRCQSFQFAPRRAANQPLSAARGAADITGVLLRGGLQILDQMSTLEAQIGALLLCVRDANSSSRSGGGGATIKVEELLPPLLRVSRTLRQYKTQRPQLQLAQTGRFPIEDFTRDLGRALTDASAEALLAVPVACQGWVLRAEWGAFWRNERREYACLSDDGVLRFFSSERQCSEFLFALARVRSGSGGGGASSAGSGVNSGAAAVSEDTAACRSLKEHAPQAQVDLTDAISDWSVRKGDAVPSERHAFALFEQQAKLRLIVDVESSDELDAWVDAISSELRQAESLASLKQTFSAFASASNSAAETHDASESLERSSSSSCVVTAESRSIDSSRERRVWSFRPPLRWLHAQVERLHGRAARHQRLQSSSLGQALKDLRRDRIAINGREFPGAHADDVLLALATSILQILRTPSRETLSAAAQALGQSSASANGDSEPHEMAAIRLAKELLVCCSRTVGGGDVLDALHLVFPSSDFSVCPKSSESEPIAVRLSSDDGLETGSCTETPVAEITIRMRYRVLFTTEFAESSLPNGDADARARDAERASTTPVDVVGTYYRRLVGDCFKWHEVDGHVHLECLR